MVQSTSIDGRSTVDTLLRNKNVLPRQTGQHCPISDLVHASGNLGHSTLEQNLIPRSHLHSSQSALSHEVPFSQLSFMSETKKHVEWNRLG
jgi:hypothetical protein